MNKMKRDGNVWIGLRLSKQNVYATVFGGHFFGSNWAHEMSETKGITVWYVKHGRYGATRHCSQQTS